jgi:SAM-dependent methyltransferase
MIDRDAVTDTAKYLRQVRPIDPDEVAEYVEGGAHPAVVRQVLREEALGLGLVEREEGTFVPASDDPVQVRFDGVDALPARYEQRLDDLLADRYGRDWHAGETGDALRETVRAFKENYLWNNSVEYDPETALAYALYHLPDYYAAVQYVLADLATEGLLPGHLRVLDVGAGVGGPALGLADFLPDDCLVDYHAVEPSDAVDVLEELLDETGRNVHPTVHRSTAEAFDPHAVFDDHGADLVLFGNVLSELGDPAAVVRSYLDALAPDGTVLALAPADRDTSIGLRDVEREVEGYEPRGTPATSLPDDAPADHPETTVYAPTVRLWTGYTPDDEGWSFDVRPDLAVPDVQQRLDRPAGSEGEFVNVDVQFSYSLLRVDGRRRYETDPSRDATARMADAPEFVTERVDLLAVKLSHDLADDGNPVFLVGDGSQRADHYAVHTRETALNDTLARADYGALLAFENVLVLWNDDEAAYNLVVDADTVVDRAG